MRKVSITISLFLGVVCIVSFVSLSPNLIEKDLREKYSRPPKEWPTPFIDPDIHWNELGTVPKSPIEGIDSLLPVIELGRKLFFDPVLSSSGKIACASCHQPALGWTDGKERSAGHEGTLNKRNSPSIQNSWFYKKLFWDGRSSGLEDQAFAPINSESEMNSDMRALPGKLKRVNGYGSSFYRAFGDSSIDPDKIATAIATFERSITSPPNRFDAFIKGNKKALSAAEIRGLHLFRTKAGCMNCHNGALFSDNEFHNNGFAGPDKGLYAVTHKEPDMGKMKTPSLRDVARTGPWMHDGKMKSLEDIIGIYNKGEAPGAEKLIRKLGLSEKEKQDLVSFLKAI